MKKRRKKLPPGSPQDWLNHAMGDLVLAQIGLQADDVLPRAGLLSCTADSRKGT